MAAVTGLASRVGVRAACDALKLARASYYRGGRAAGSPFVVAARPLPARALRPAERETVLAISTKKGFRIALRPLCMRRFSMKGDITARFAPCIGIPRRPRSAHASALPDAGTAGDGCQSTLELDITKLLGPGKWT